MRLYAPEGGILVPCSSPARYLSLSLGVSLVHAENYTPAEYFSERSILNDPAISPRS